jgi:two-component system LytT family response regulator
LSRNPLKLNLSSTAITAFLLDDEPIYHQHLSKIISGFTEVKLTESFTDPEVAVRAILKSPPEILFLDIEMKGKDGFWVADQIKHLPVLIAFVTSHTEYALKAFNYYALHYIEKPVEPKDISDLIGKYKLMKQGSGIQMTQQVNEMLNDVLKRFDYPTRIYLNNQENILVLSLSDIIYISANGSYTDFHMRDGKTHVSSKTLKCYTEIVEKNPDFVRIHRSYLINLQHLHKIEKKDFKYQFIMSDNTRIEVATFKKQNWMDRYI